MPLRPCKSKVAPDCSQTVTRHSKHSICLPCTMLLRNATRKPELSKDSLEVTGNTAVTTKLVDTHIRSLAQLIKVCEIDTNEWEVERFVCNKWEVGSMNRKTNQVDVTPLFQVKAWLKRKVALMAARDEVAALVKLAQEQIGPRPSMAPRLTKTDSGRMLEINIPDLHVGKLAWGKETGDANYDSQIAREIYESAINALLERTKAFGPFQEIVFVVGNDLFHADNLNNTTTKGTQLETDSRFQRTFHIVRSMTIATIERLRPLTPRVRVVLVPGNHDQLTVWHLGHSLEGYFGRTFGVEIDNTPKLRKYLQFGKVMLLFTHGDKGKLSDYPLTMATEEPDMWGQTDFREAHTGDKHHTRVHEFHGVRVRILPALCAADAWHSSNFYVKQQRAAEAFVWSAEDGLIGAAMYTVPRGRNA